MSDTRREAEAAAARVEQTIADLRLTGPRVMAAAVAGAHDASASGGRTRPGESRLPGMRVPPFPPEPLTVDLLVGLRAAGRQARWDDPHGWDDVVLALSYHLGQLVDDGREDDACRVLRFFARDTYVMPTGKPHPLADLAKAVENAGYRGLAATAYALAYTATRGGMGYARFGDRAHGGLLARALAFDASAARQLVAEATAYGVRGSWYSIGTSKHLIERIADWGEPDVAAAAWREAAAVVAHR